MGFDRTLTVVPRAPTVLPAEPAVATHRYCLRCDVPFTGTPRCPGCAGLGISDRDPVDDGHVAGDTGPG